MPDLNVLGSTLKSVMEFLTPKFINSDGSNTTITDGQFLVYINGKVITNGWRPSVVGDVGVLQEDGTPSVGTSLALALLDHVHPSDSTKADVDHPTFSGTTIVENLVRPVSAVEFTQAGNLSLVMGTYYFLESYGYAIGLNLPEVTSANVGGEITIKSLTLNQGSTGTMSFNLYGTNVFFGDAPASITSNNVRRTLIASSFNNQYGWISV